MVEVIWRIETETVPSYLQTRILVRDVMNSPVITGSAETTVGELARTMMNYRIGSVVIVDGDRTLGIVTDSDIVMKCVAKDLAPNRTAAKQIMSSPLHTVDSDKEITQAARLMRKLGVKRLGVTYKEKLVGIVSISDLVAVTPELMDIVSEKARISAGETLRQRAYVAGYCDLCEVWSDYLMEMDGRFVCEDCRGGASKE